MKPSNFIGEWHDDTDTDNYDFTCSEAVGCFYQLLYNDNNTSTIEWAKDAHSSYHVWGDTIADVVMKKRGWKKGDLKNGWKSIEINGNTPYKYEHLFLPLTIDWHGVVLSWKFSTYILHP